MAGKEGRDHSQFLSKTSNNLVGSRQSGVQGCAGRRGIPFLCQAHDGVTPTEGENMEGCELWVGAGDLAGSRGVLGPRV